MTDQLFCCQATGCPYNHLDKIKFFSESQNLTIEGLIYVDSERSLIFILHNAKYLRSGNKTLPSKKLVEPYQSSTLIVDVSNPNISCWNLGINTYGLTRFNLVPKSKVIDRRDVDSQENAKRDIEIKNITGCPFNHLQNVKIIVDGSRHMGLVFIHVEKRLILLLHNINDGLMLSSFDNSLNKIIHDESIKKVYRCCTIMCDCDDAEIVSWEERSKHHKIEVSAVFSGFTNIDEKHEGITQPEETPNYKMLYFEEKENSEALQKNLGELQEKYSVFTKNSENYYYNRSLVLDRRVESLESELIATRQLVVPTRKNRFKFWFEGLVDYLRNGNKIKSCDACGSFRPVLYNVSTLDVITHNELLCLECCENKNVVVNPTMSVIVKGYNHHKHGNAKS